MVKDGGGGPKMFLEPFPKGHTWLIYVLLFTISIGTLKPVHYSTFLHDLILVLGGHQEISDSVATLKMYLDSHLTTYSLRVFANPFGIGGHSEDIAVVVIVVSLMSVLGLINTISMADVGLSLFKAHVGYLHS